MIESQITYVLDCLRMMERQRTAVVDVRPEAQRDWNAEVQARMPPTVWNSGGCASWYLDANGRNSTLWPDFTFCFRQQTRRFDAESYRLERAGESATRDAAPLPSGTFRLARQAPKLTSTFSSSTRSSVLAAWRRARRSPRVSGGFMRLRGHRWRLRTTLISAARTVTWEPR